MAATAEWLDTDFYRVLGVPETATDKEITKAYRKRARELHPDINPDPSAAERFKDLGVAYDVLGDPEKRREYDELRRLSRTRTSGPTAHGGRRIRVDQTDTGYPFGAVDIDDLFDGWFGGSVRTSQRAPRATRGQDLTADVNLSFEQAVHGTTAQVSVHDERSHRTIKARIPAGVEDGQIIRLSGRGRAGQGGGPAGDVLVRVHVAPHRLFGRRGRDLTLTVPVTFAEAALGADISVPTLRAPVTVRIPPGTPTGKTFRVRGHGVPTRNGTGDLLVTVEVAVPTRLTPEQRSAVEALAAATRDSPRAHLPT